MRMSAVLRQFPALENSSSGEASDAVQRRRSQRRCLQLAAVARSPAIGETEVLIRDISPKGLLIEAEAHALSVEDWIDIQLPELKTARARVVWADGRIFGCEFREPISAGAISASVLKSSSPFLAEQPRLDKGNATLSRGGQPSFVPEQNFSAALSLSVLLWATFALAAYLLVL